MKKYYDVKVDCLIPAVVTYRVLAEDEQQAADLAFKSNPTNIHYKFNLKKRYKMFVYDAGTTMIKFMKNFFGR